MKLEALYVKLPLLENTISKIQDFWGTQHFSISVIWCEYLSRYFFLVVLDTGNSNYCTMMVGDDFLLKIFHLNSKSIYVRCIKEFNTGQFKKRHSFKQLQLGLQLAPSIIRAKVHINKDLMLV